MTCGVMLGNSTLVIVLFFFFQAEDGIRDYKVTGVQTCALPIYFHGQGLYELEGDDYVGIFRLDGEPSPEILPPYTELGSFDAGPRLAGAELREGARASLRRHLDRRPRSDPFERFGAQLVRDLPVLAESGPEAYHAYAFATVRMVGAAFELAATQAEWLLGGAAQPAGAAMSTMVEGGKVLGFRRARRREFDPQPILESLS